MSEGFDNFSITFSSPFLSIFFPLFFPAYQPFCFTLFALFLPFSLPSPLLLSPQSFSLLTLHSLFLWSLLLPIVSHLSLPLSRSPIYSSDSHFFFRPLIHILELYGCNFIAFNLSKIGKRISCKNHHSFQLILSHENSTSTSCQVSWIRIQSQLEQESTINNCKFKYSIPYHIE